MAIFALEIQVSVYTLFPIESEGLFNEISFQDNLFHILTCCTFVVLYHGWSMLLSMQCGSVRAK